MTESEIPEEIRAQSTDRLLTLFAELTHKIHAAEQRTRSLSDSMAGAAVGVVSNLRGQRDIVKREILHRCDEV